MNLFLMLSTFATFLVYLPTLYEDSIGAPLTDQLMESYCEKRVDNYVECSESSSARIFRITINREHGSPTAQRSLFGMEIMTALQHSTAKNGVHNQGRRKVMRTSHKAPFVGRWKKRLVIVSNPELKQFF